MNEFNFDPEYKMIHSYEDDLRRNKPDRHDLYLDLLNERRALDSLQKGRTEGITPIERLRLLTDIQNLDEETFQQLRPEVVSRKKARLIVGSRPGEILGLSQERIQKMRQRWESYKDGGPLGGGPRD